jgi:hypothetical protein
MILESILIISIVTLVLLIWFESDAFVEYTSAFGGDKFGGVGDYRLMSPNRPSLTYVDFLREEHGTNFFVKLISCPLCFSFWVTMLVTFLVSDTLWMFPACNILSLILYKVTAKILTI